MARAVIPCLAAATILGLCLVWVPQADIAISAVFGDENGFALGQSPILKAVRTMMILLTDGAMAVALIVLIIQGSFRGMCLLDQRILAFAVTSYVVGPGLIVNGLLKGFYGRARPSQLEIFGGDRSFSPAFAVSDQCEKYCSFVSGEASALATVAAVLLLLFAKRLPDTKRVVAISAIVTVVLLGSGLRVAFGAHFLSDVLFAWILSVAVVAWLYAAFEIEPADPSARAQHIAALQTTENRS
ncbi:phosphatase PAP2 family protein [uncultured Jannaschia sp.]|uniref:phosphatase PAP2 family protein n=1 Tax=uncultured Jannaschia sp. TaxID=293347 RepID=UPI0026116D22|nr:phosphatase PAP2 family protein [uncultured Jannaschia sp.]